MEIIKTTAGLSTRLSEAREAGKSIGLVPTMGALHAGHLSLVERARRENDIVVVSVFVNPTQFNNPDDLRTYPRTVDADCRLLSEAGVDYAFVPSVDEIYPEPDTRVFNLGPVAETMEGAMRPGHFNGVAQIVSKLFAMTNPVFEREGAARFTVVWPKLKISASTLWPALYAAKPTDLPSAPAMYV